MGGCIPAATTRKDSSESLADSELDSVERLLSDSVDELGFVLSVSVMLIW